MSGIKTKVPSSWELVKLGDFVESQKGKKPKNEAKNESSSHPIPYVDIQAFEEKIVRTWTDGVGCHPCYESDFLMVWDGSRSGLVGKGMNGALGSTLVRINFPMMVNDYAYYFLQSKYQQINTRAKGSGTPHVDPDLLWNYDFPIPPLAEQHRIVQKIEELFSELESGIDNLKLAQQQLNIYRLTLLNEAFNGALTKIWRDKNAPNIESAKEIKSRIDPASSNRSPSRAVGSKREYVDMADDFPVLPDSWVYMRAGDICDFITKGTTPAKQDLYESSGEIPFIKVYNLTKTGALDFTINPTFIKKDTHENFLARSRVYPGDVLMNIVGPPLGKVSIVPPLYEQWNINQAIAIFRTSYIRADLLAMYLSFDKTINYMMSKAKATVGQFNLTLEICRDTPIPIFDAKEQDVLAGILNGKLSEVDAVEKTINQSLDFSDALRQAILQKAFSGKLVPQDPNDEPASKLLSRIKAEVSKSKLSKKKKDA